MNIIYLFINILQFFGFLKPKPQPHSQIIEINTQEGSPRDQPRFRLSRDHEEVLVQVVADSPRDQPRIRYLEQQVAPPFVPPPLEEEIIWGPPSICNKYEKLKTVSKAKFNQMCDTECSVCFTAYKNGEMATTECGHTYCIQCWGDWWENQTAARVTCPTCRKLTPVVTYLRVRASKI
jgi:hypothetical protein